MAIWSVTSVKSSNYVNTYWFSKKVPDWASAGRQAGVLPLETKKLITRSLSIYRLVQRYLILSIIHPSLTDPLMISSG